MVRVFVFTLFLTHALIAQAQHEQSEHWPEHRGPNHDYHLRSQFDYPLEWSVTSGKNIVWRMPLPETGHSGIAIWGDKLFLTCFKKLTDRDNGPKGT